MNTQAPVGERLRALASLQHATGIDAAVLLVAGEQRGAAPSNAAARVRARVGEHTWARAMKEPSYSLSRTLLLVEAMDPHLDAKIAAFESSAHAGIRPDVGTQIGRIAALAADRRAGAPRRNAARAPVMSAAALDQKIAAAREEQELAARAARSGMTIDERRRAEENVNRGMAGPTDDDLRAYATTRGYDEDKADRFVATYHTMNKGRS